MPEEVFDPLEAEPIARKKMVMFYLIDTSSSMDGSKIGIVNQVMEELVPEVRNLGNADSDIYFAVMSFNSDCSWITPEPQSVETFQWNRLTATGMTSMGEAFRELNSKMSRHAFLSAPHLSLSPVIFLLSDGEPTDNAEDPLKALKENRWFKNSLKVAVGAGDFNDEILVKFTGNRELVLKATNGKDLAELIRFATITSSTIGSRSMGFGAGGSVKQDSAELREQAFIDMKKDTFGDDGGSPTVDDLDMDDSGW